MERTDCDSVIGHKSWQANENVSSGIENMRAINTSTTSLFVPLLLSTTELDTTFADFSLKFLWKVIDKSRICKSRRLFDLFVRWLPVGPFEPVHNVSLDTPGKQRWLLANNRNIVAQLSTEETKFEIGLCATLNARAAFYLPILGRARELRVHR